MGLFDLEKSNFGPPHPKPEELHKKRLDELAEIGLNGRPYLEVLARAIQENGGRAVARVMIDTPVVAATEGTPGEDGPPQEAAA